MKNIALYLVALCCAIISCSTSEGEKPAWYIDPMSIAFDANGGTQNVRVITNFDYEIKINVDWLSVERCDDYWLKVTAAASMTTDVRNGEITILSRQHGVAEVISVSQEGHINWAELPEVVENENWEYCYHDKLPSNNKLRNYSFCFDKEKHCALWVAYPLHECYTEGGGKRTNAWGYDPCCVDDKEEPNLFNAYYPQGGSSYSHSRGHQLPSADRLASNEDNATTFYFTNMTPQVQSLNGATWESLEGDVRNKWMCSDTLYVVTGAHFDAGYGYAYDNKGSGKACAVPTHYYKVILRTKSGNSGKWVGECSANELKCVGFWFDHADKAPRQTMSVAEIEQKTGHTFFPNVPNAPKSTYKASEW